jgi:hypothetical protein
MKKLYFLIILKLIFLSSVSYAQTYQSLNINGFNQDVIANGIGTAATSTTSDVDGVSYSFKSIDWMLTSESSPQTVGFPVNGIINSEATPGVMYQLKDYSTSNSIQLKSSNPSIISNVSGSVKAKKLFVLVTSGSGVSSLTCKITFEDNTKEVFSDIAISDWYSGTSPAIAFRGFGRIGRMNNIVEYSSSNPRLYEASLPISVANENKAIKNIEFLRESSSGGVLNIFAVSAQKYINCPNPLAVTISDISGTTAKVNLTLPSVLPSSGYDYEVRTSGAPGSGAIGLVSSGTISFDSTVYNLLNLPALKKLYFYIRSNCGTTGVQDWMETISFVTNCEIPKLIYTNSENTCKNSSATLSAHYDSGTIRWFDSSTSDTLLAVGNSFVTPNLSSSKSYWVEAMATEFLNSSAGKKDLGGLSNDVNTFDNWGIVFDLNQDVLLKSTDIFVGNYGTLDIAIKDNLGNELFSTGDISVNTSDIDKRATIPLNFKLTAGTGYRMVIKSFSEIKLFRDSYASFPYKDDNDVLIVTSGFFDGFTKDYYYYFYNIAFEKECFSPRTEVIATIYDTPVPTASNQEFCIAEAKTIDDLVVTGTDVKWYNEVTGGTALDPTTVLVSGTYYATQTLNGCESVDRTEVAVTIRNTPAPTAADQAFCIAESKMIDDLVVTGTDVKWYNEVTDGTALDPTTVLVSGTYYATQTLNGCESVDRTEVVVTIYNTPAPTAADQAFCITESKMIDDLVVTGTDVKWYNTQTSGTALDPTTVLISGTYYATQTLNGCESVDKTEVVVTIYNTPAPTAADQAFCIAESKMIDDLVVTGTDVKWYNEVTGGTALDPTTVLVSGTYYATQTLNGCESVDRTEVVVTIYNTPAPTTADQAFCIAESKMIDDLVVTGTDVKWYNTQTSGTALDATALLIDGTTYYATQTLNNCESVDRTPVVVTIEAPTAPTVNATIQYTYGETAVALTATTSANHSLLWYTTETGGTSINTSPTPTTDAVGTQTYWVSQVTTNGCESKRTKIEVIINQATLTITADVNQSKMYGETDPVLTYTDSGYQGTDDNSILSGALSRVAGEDVGTYVIEQGTLTAGDNYDIVFVSDDFTINKATLTITADANQSKGYGETDPVLTYTDSGYQGTDDNSILSGALSRAAGENVGTYAIEQGTLTAGDNYDIVFVSNDFTINKATLTITADANQSKGYGETDPVLTYTVSGYQHSDDNSILSGALSRIAGENVGTYAIEQGTLTAGDNYDIVFISNDFTINKATLTIPADANQSKGYGETDPVLTYTVSGYQHSDDNSILSGALSRIAGENVGTYAIEQGTLTAGDNYDIVFVSDDFTINKAILTITADANQSKGYGETDPVLTYTDSGYQGTDDNSILSGALSRIAGENVGTYAIEQGTLTAGDNYDIVFVSNDFTINKATLTITADANQSKGYGETDPVLTYTDSGYQHSDNNSILSGALSRAAGEDVGIYAIEQGTLTAGDNYDIVFVSDDFTITKATLTITPHSGQGKTYGSTNPVYPYDISGFVLGDTAAVINGALGRQSGENVGTYLYNAGSLTAQNYTFVIIEEYFAITPAPIEVHVNPGQSKAYGATDPVLTYTANGLVNGDTQANAFTGSLQRVPGENTGVYAIKQGTLQPNANYQLTSFTGADFEIKKAVITGIKLENAAFVYDGTPKSLYLTGNIQPGAQVSYTGNGQTEAGEYTVTATVDYGSNYEILVLTAKLKIVQAEQVIDFELNSPVILEDMTPFQLDATASSGLAVYYSFNYIENHPAMVSSDGHVALMEPGTVEITAHQEGNNNYKAAQPITRTLVVESRDSRIWELYIDGDKYENPSQETRVIKGCDDTDSPFVEIQVETQAGATVSPSEVIVVPTPEYGTYEVEIIVTSPNAKHSQTYKVIIEKRLPWEGVLMQKYDNLVFVNNNPATNGGHKFVRYQWYKNGVKVADHKVFSEGAAMDDILDPEAEYHAILYTQDGQVLTTCTMGVRLRHDYALSVYPNPVAKKQTLNVRVDDPKEAFEQSDYSIYSQTGQLIQRGKLTQALSAIGLPPTIQAGTYILVLKIDGEHKSVHFVVKP